MALNPLNSSNLEQLAFKGLKPGKLFSDLTQLAAAILRRACAIKNLTFLLPVKIVTIMQTFCVVLAGALIAVFS